MRDILLFAPLDVDAFLYSFSLFFLLDADVFLYSFSLFFPLVFCTFLSLVCFCPHPESHGKLFSLQSDLLPPHPLWLELRPEVPEGQEMPSKSCSSRCSSALGGPC